MRQRAHRREFDTSVSVNNFSTHKQQNLLSSLASDQAYMEQKGTPQFASSKLPWINAQKRGGEIDTVGILKGSKHKTKLDSKSY